MKGCPISKGSPNFADIRLSVDTLTKLERPLRYAISLGDGGIHRFKGYSKLLELLSKYEKELLADFVSEAVKLDTLTSSFERSQHVRHLYAMLETFKTKANANGVPSALEASLDQEHGSSGKFEGH